MLGNVQFPLCRHVCSQIGTSQCCPVQPAEHRHVFGATQVPLLKHPRITSSTHTSPLTYRRPSTYSFSSSYRNRGRNDFIEINLNYDKDLTHSIHKFDSPNRYLELKDYLKRHLILLLSSLCLWHSPRFGKYG